MKKDPDMDEKISLNVERFRLFLREFSEYSLEQKIICAKKIDDAYYKEFKSFFNCYISAIIGKL